MSGLIPFVANPHQEIFRLLVGGDCHGEIDDWVVEVPLHFLVVFKHLLLFKWVPTLGAQDLEMAAEEGHISWDAGSVMNFLGSAALLHWAKGNVFIHHLTILQELLQADNIFLHGGFTFEFDGRLR